MDAFSSRTCGQWRRSVVKYEGVMVSQVKPSNCFRLHPTPMISNTQQSRFLAAGRHLEILVLYKSFILDDVKLAELSNNSFQ